MGLLYSITQTVYSYVYPSTKISLTPQKITTFAKKLSIGIQHKMKKLKNNNFKLQTEFINKINTDKYRDKFNQNILIDHMIMEAIKCGVYQQLLNCTKHIESQAQLISDGLDKVSQQCLTAIFAVVHLYKDFQLDQFIDIKEFLPEPYPIISVNKLDQRIKRYLKFKSPTQYERNLFVIEMCKRHEGRISILKLNEANHSFSQYPQINQLKQQQSNFNSNGLYARSASINIDPQQQQLQHKLRRQQYELQMDQFAA